MAKKPNKPTITRSFNLKLFLATRKHLVYSVTLIASGVLILVFAAIPQISSILANNSQLKKQQVELAKTEKKALELEQIKLLPEFAQANKVDEVLPSHKPLLELLTGLTQTAQATKIVIREFELSPGEIASPGAEIKPSTKNKNLGYDTLDVKLSIDGKLYQVEDFITTIEFISPLTTITEISLQRETGDTKDKETRTKANLELSTFFFTQSLKTTLKAPLPKVGQTEIDIFNQIKEFSPSQLKSQTEIIIMENEDLFGIEGLKIENLEQQVEEQSLLQEFEEI